MENLSLVHSYAQDGFCKSWYLIGENEISRLTAVEFAEARRKTLDVWSVCLSVSVGVYERGVRMSGVSV